jgi:hypothetical protein
VDVCNNIYNECIQTCVRMRVFTCVGGGGLGRGREFFFSFPKPGF